MYYFISFILWVVATNVTQPPKSYFYLPVKLYENVKKIESALLYVTLLQYLQDRYNLQALTKKVPIDNPTILVINPTRNKIAIQENSPNGIY